MSNKDEALRAAVELMRKADFTAARRFAEKAQKLDTSPENVVSVSGMIMVCDVHCAALEKSGDETDWYKILQVEQNADDSTIKKQFKKLALHLHPDKNKLPGADSAFRLIKDAEIILLDKDKRRRHDMKRKHGETVVEISSSCSESCYESDSSCSESCYESEEVPQAEDQKMGSSRDSGARNVAKDSSSGSSKRKRNFGKKKASVAGFRVSVSKSYLGSLLIPAYFVKDHLPRNNRMYKIYNRDMKKSWDVGYWRNENQGYEGRFSGGWTQLCKDYPVAVGDTCEFTLINSNEPVLIVSKP